MISATILITDNDIADKITSFVCSTISLPMQWLIAGFLLLFTILVLVLIEIKSRKSPPKRSFLIFCSKMIAFAIILCIGIWGFATASVATTAIKHGCTDLMSYKTSTLIQLNKTTPKESDLPPNLNHMEGCLILYYRYGCADCDAVYQDLLDATADLPNVYWVSTRSDTGEILRTSYPVTEVPSGVYVSKTGAVLTKSLITSGNNPHLNEENLNQLLFTMKSELSQN